MGSPDYREQFTFVAGQLDRFGLAYLHVMDGLAVGFHNLGEPMTLAEFREGIPRSAYGQLAATHRDTAEKAIADGHADLDLLRRRPYIGQSGPCGAVQEWLAAGENRIDALVLAHRKRRGYTDFPAIMKPKRKEMPWSFMEFKRKRQIGG